MLVSTWLALAGLPVFFQPLPQSPDQTAVAAIASGVGLHAPCLRLRCPGYEWQRPSAAITYRERPAPVSASSLPGARPAGMQGLSAPYSSQLWSTSYFNDLGIGTSLGMNPFRTPATDVRMAFGPALRIQPYVDDGTARRGLVARGLVAMNQKLGDHARLTQQVSIEKGPANTFVRNSFGVDVFLHPQWVLDSDIETVHDTVPDGRGVTDTTGTVNLRYSF
ncbi:MAG: DUF481 domain-containing protein [Thermomonas sp.]